MSEEGRERVSGEEREGGREGEREGGRERGKEGSMTPLLQTLGKTRILNVFPTSPSMGLDKCNMYTLHVHILLLVHEMTCIYTCTCISHCDDVTMES